MLLQHPGGHLGRRLGIKQGHILPRLQALAGIRHLHIQNPVLGLSTVLNQQQGPMPVLPADHGQVLEGLMVPVHLAHPGIVVILAQEDQTQPGAGVGGQSLGIPPSARPDLGIGRIADVPNRLIGGIRVLDQQGPGWWLPSAGRQSYRPPWCRPD